MKGKSKGDGEFQSDQDSTSGEDMVVEKPKVTTKKNALQTKTPSHSGNREESIPKLIVPEEVDSNESDDNGEAVEMDFENDSSDNGEVIEMDFEDNSDDNDLQHMSYIDKVRDLTGIGNAEKEEGSSDEYDNEYDLAAKKIFSKKPADEESDSDDSVDMKLAVKKPSKIVKPEISKAVKQENSKSLNAAKKLKEIDSEDDSAIKNPIAEKSDAKKLESSEDDSVDMKPVAKKPLKIAKEEDPKSLKASKKLESGEDDSAIKEPIVVKPLKVVKEEGPKSLKASKKLKDVEDDSAIKEPIAEKPSKVVKEEDSISLKVAKKVENDRKVELYKTAIYIAKTDLSAKREKLLSSHPFVIEAWKTADNGALLFFDSEKVRNETITWFQTMKYKHLNPVKAEKVKALLEDTTKGIDWTTLHFLHVPKRITKRHFHTLFPDAITVKYSTATGAIIGFSSKQAALTAFNELEKFRLFGSPVLIKFYRVPENEPEKLEPGMKATSVNDSAKAYPKGKKKKFVNESDQLEPSKDAKIANEPVKSRPKKKKAKGVNGSEQLGSGKKVVNGSEQLKSDKKEKVANDSGKAHPKGKKKKFVNDSVEAHPKNKKIKFMDE